MCAIYTIVNDPERLKRYFGAGEHPAFPVETWHGYVAPFILHSPDQTNRERLLAVGGWHFRIGAALGKRLHSCPTHVQRPRRKCCSETHLSRFLASRSALYRAGRVIFRAQLGVRQGRPMED